MTPEAKTHAETLTALMAEHGVEPPWPDTGPDADRLLVAEVALLDGDTGLMRTAKKGSDGQIQAAADRIRRSDREW